MKITAILLIAMIISSSSLLPEVSYGQLKTYQFEQIESLQKKEPRTVVVFIHTDWCKYCKAMQNTSFKNDRIVELLNKHFYLVDLNAEEKKSINFNGHSFHYRPTGNDTGVHELAEQLGNIEGKIAYPSMCFLNAENEIVYQHSGFTDSDTLQKILEQLR